jgi:hypothetical protein
MSEDSAIETTRNSLVRELYDVSAEYQATCRRLRETGVSEDQISRDFYVAAIRSYLDQIAVFESSNVIADVQLRHALINLSTIALRYARKLRMR